MIIPGFGYWNIGIGRKKCGFDGDEDGVGTMLAIGCIMAWLLQKIAI